MQVRIEPVTTRGGLNTFIMLPWQIYRGDPNWVPPLISEMKKLFNRDRFPFFRHSSAEFMLAFDGSRPVGRIAAIHNTRHCEFHAEPVGFFGFFECADNREAAERLFEAVADWLRARGLKAMRGPMNYSTNDTCGLLVDGFDSPPFILMPHNPRYYPGLVEACGFSKAKDLLAYLLTTESFVPDSQERGRFVVPELAGTGARPGGTAADSPDGRPSSDPAQAPGRVARSETPRSLFEQQKKLAERLAARYEVKIRHVDMSRFREEVDVIRQIYNGAWEKNWGFIPMTEAEFDYMASELKPVVKPEFLLFAEVKGKPAAFALALPNLNVALAKLNGRLFPTGLIKLLWHARNIRSLRVLTLGILKEYRRHGIDALLYLSLIERAIAKDYTSGELS
ncbi:MAG: hypothetical protein RDV41_14530, partial [Planctomycetota bacterium]|nr:hypothetical protein [Planctomycetota bacterium]